MKREFSRLESGAFDLLVVGGGIYGAWIALDAALRGLSTALVEQEDWAAGTSSRSSKLLHGGLRYLEHLELGLVRKSLHERRLLWHLGPHRVHALRFLLPFYSGGRLGRVRLKAGLWLYDRLAGSGQPVPPHRSVTREELLAGHPFLARGSLRGGFVYGDCGTDDARLVVEVVDGACTAGAAAVNRARVVGLLREGGRVTGATVLDRESGGSAEVRARVTVNAAGPWVDRMAGMEAARRRPEVRLTKGVHLVLPALPGGDAVLLTARSDGRVFFLIPWYGRTLLGTTDTDYAGDPGEIAATAEDEAYLLEAVAPYLDPPPGPETVLGRYAGLRALHGTAGRRPSAVSRRWALSEAIPGLLAAVGGKLTSARADAARVVDRVLAGLGRKPGPALTGERRLPWAPEGDFAAWCARTESAGVAAGMDAASARAAARRHGSRSGRLHALLNEQPELARPLVPGLPFCRGEVIVAVRHEMARSLEDVVRRRIPAAILAVRDAGWLSDAAALAGVELGWTPKRRQAEVAAVLAGAG